MRVLHLFAEKPGDLAVRLLEVQSRDHEVKTIQLQEGAVSYEEVVTEIFAADRVISWNG